MVHIAIAAPRSGYQAARAAAELGIPTVAIYQTDLVGFAERYDIRSGRRRRAMTYLTRKIHTQVDRTLAPSTASLRQLQELGVPRLALWPRGVDLEAFHPAAPRRGAAPAARARRPAAGRVRRPAGRREGARAAHPPAPTTRATRWWSSGRARGAAAARLLPTRHFLGVLHGADLGRAYASLDVFVHTGRHETYCQSAQEALASGVPVVAPRAGGPLDVVADGVTGLLYEPG